MHESLEQNVVCESPSASMLQANSNPHCYPMKFSLKKARRGEPWMARLTVEAGC